MNCNQTLGGVFISKTEESVFEGKKGDKIDGEFC